MTSRHLHEPTPNAVDAYRVGRGEQGVLTIEPYKSVLLPLWRFKTPAIAAASAQALWEKFVAYKAAGDFPGMDMARKFLQMGYTRSRRYANHASGKKYDGPVPQDKKGQSGAHGRAVLPRDADPDKAASAAIFKQFWDRVQADPDYRRLLQEARAREKAAQSGARTTPSAQAVRT